MQTGINRIGNTGLVRFEAITNAKGSLRVDAAALNAYLYKISYHPGVSGVILHTEDSTGTGFYVMRKPFTKGDWEQCFSVGVFGYLDYVNTMDFKRGWFHSITVELIGWFEEYNTDEDSEENTVSYEVRVYKPEDVGYTPVFNKKTRRQAWAITNRMEEENKLYTSPVLAISKNGYLGVITEEDEPPISNEQVVIWYGSNPVTYTKTNKSWDIYAKNRYHMINLLPYKGWTPLNR